MWLLVLCFPVGINHLLVKRRTDRDQRPCPLSRVRDVVRGLWYNMSRGFKRDNRHHQDAHISYALTRRLSCVPVRTTEHATSCQVIARASGAKPKSPSLPVFRLAATKRWDLLPSSFVHPISHETRPESRCHCLTLDSWNCQAYWYYTQLPRQIRSNLKQDRTTLFFSSFANSRPWRAKKPGSLSTYKQPNSAFTIRHACEKIQAREYVATSKPRR